MHAFGIHANTAPSPPDADFTISADVTNWNLLAQLGYTPDIPLDVTITIAAGKTVRATNTSTPAMDLTGLFATSTLSIVNAGAIHGRGGAGGGGDGNAGSSGGDAIKGPGSGVTFSITNAAGYIFGGGGGGGGGGYATESFESSPGEFEPRLAGGGGGGGGAGGGAKGIGGNSSGAGASDGADGTAGTNGSAGVPGTGGMKGTVIGCNGGDGGDGGDWAAVGTAGDSGTNGDTNVAGGAAGAAGGKAIDLNGGSVSFVSGNTAARVKGAVS